MAAATTLSPSLMSVVLALPAATAPAGTTSNFVNPASDFSSIIATLVICTTLATVAVLVRLYTKAVVTRQMLVEDYTIVAGFLLFIAMQVPAMIAAVSYGNGKDEWNVRISDFSYGLYLDNIVMIIYSLATLFIKVSILLQYLRIFVPSPQHSKITFFSIWITTIGIAIYYLTMTGFLFGLCNPREKIWNIFVTSGSCFSVNALVEASGVMNIVSDVIILIIPIGCVWKLQLPTRRKMAVSAMFGVGSLAIISSIVRCYYSFELAITNNITSVISFLGMAAAAECTMGIVVSCMPALPRFYESVRPKVYSFVSGNKNKASNMSSTILTGDSYRLNARSRHQSKGSTNVKGGTIGSTSRRTGGFSDPWNDSVLRGSYEKQQVPTSTVVGLGLGLGANSSSSVYPSAGDRDLSMHGGRGLVTETTVVSLSSPATPARVASGRGRGQRVARERERERDLERGGGGDNTTGSGGGRDFSLLPTPTPFGSHGSSHGSGSGLGLAGFDPELIGRNEIWQTTSIDLEIEQRTTL